MPRDVMIMAGLNTDSPPDQLGDQALRLLNVTPASAISMKPRWAWREVAQYQPVLLGRVFIVDALPYDETNGLLIVCQNNKDISGVISHYNEANFEWRPSGLPADFAFTLGTIPGTKVYGVFGAHFKILDFLLDTYLTLDPSTVNGFTPRFPFFVRQGTYDERGYSGGEVFTFNSGVMVIAGSRTLPSPKIETHVYDVATLDLTEDVNLDGAGTGASTAFNVGGCPLCSPYNGYVLWWNDSGDNTPRLRIILNGRFNLPGQGLEGWGTIGFPISNAAVLTGAQIADVSPIGRVAWNTLLVAKRSTTNTDDALGYQLVLIQQDINLPADGATSLTYTTIAAKNYLVSDWVGWNDRPNTCLDAQLILYSGKVNAGRIVALLGNWVSPTLHKAVSNPRLAMMNGATQTGTGLRIVHALDLLNSHPTGAVTDLTNPHALATTSTGTPSGSTVVWTPTGTRANTGNIVAAAKTTYIKATNYGFALPSGATIDYITVTVVRASNLGSLLLKDNSAKLIKAGTISGNDLAQTSFWSQGAEVTVYGGTPTDWGVTLVGSDINNSGFGFALSAINDGGFTTTATVFSVQIEVAYDAGGFHGHCMMADQFGYVYATGTGDFVQNEATYLILKYDPHDFTNAVARVAHNSNGLGDYYADPLDTHICGLMIDGAYVMVLDVDAVKTRLFIYDYNLNFLAKLTMGPTTVGPTEGQTAANVGAGVTQWTPTQAPGAGVASNTVIGSSLTDPIDITDFGFNLPSDAVIAGVSVEISRKTNANAAADSALHLLISGTPTGTDKASGASWPGSFASHTYGGASDLWGCTLNASVVNASNFGIRLIAGMDVTSAPQTASIQFVKITLYFDNGNSPVLANKFATKFFAQNY